MNKQEKESRPLSLREQVASALGINREPAYMLTDSEILSAILELKAGSAEDARQLQEAQGKYSDQLEEARVEYVKSRAECDARCGKLTASWLTESHECRRLQQQLDRLRR